MRDPADRLVAELRGRITDERVLSAVRAVPRELFVPEALRAEAWDNVPLPIGCAQTISQPLVVARMCELLELTGGERVLDVGTGSGYHAALLAHLAAEVHSIELHAELSDRAARVLARIGAPVTLAVGDGSRGLPAHAPFDAINVAAAARGGVPLALVEQLAPGGRLVAPIEENGDQYLALVRESGGELRTTRMERVRFVPLISGRG